jgi:hypothetical protein
MDNKGSCSVTTSCSTDKKKGDCAPKKSCVDTMVKGAFAGGIVMFLYLMASWMLFPWHMSTMHAFKNEKVVAKAILDNVEGSGIYVLPYVKNPGDKPAVDKPFAFVSVKAGGFDCAKLMNMTMFREFVLCLFLATLLTCIMKKQSCGCPVGFAMKIGLFVAFAHNVPNLIWWQYPLNFSLISMVDDFVAVTLAGLAISKLALSSCAPKGVCGGCGCPPGQCKCSGGSGGTTKPSCGA